VVRRAAGIKCTPLLWVAYLAGTNALAPHLLLVVVAVAVNLFARLTIPPRRACLGQAIGSHAILLRWPISSMTSRWLAASAAT